MVEDVKIRLDTQEAQDGIGSLTEALVELRDTVEEISAWDLGGVAEEMNVIAEDLGQIEALLSGGPDGGTWVSTLSDMVSLGGVLGEVFSTVVDVLAGLSPGMIAGIAAAVHMIVNFFETLISFVSDIGVGIAQMLAGIVELILNVFSGDWERVWNSVTDVFCGLMETVGGFVRGAVNVLLTGINLLIGVLYSVIGGVIDFFNGIASVAGNIVGEDWSFPVPVDPPQIPLLARGAVLPANRPFLAMVGDQRHGTNVEAPLATIQEAVALVMGDQISAMMAGFREVLREQQALRAAVEGIEVGDEVIGRAAARYGERMAVVRGGA